MWHSECKWYLPRPRVIRDTPRSGACHNWSHLRWSNTNQTPAPPQTCGIITQGGDWGNEANIVTLLTLTSLRGPGDVTPLFLDLVSVATRECRQHRARDESGINYYYFMPSPRPCEATNLQCTMPRWSCRVKASARNKCIGPEEGLIIIQSDCDLVLESQGVSLSLPVWCIANYWRVSTRLSRDFLSLRNLFLLN